MNLFLAGIPTEVIRQNLDHVDYHLMIEHSLAQRVMNDRLDKPIPFIIFDPFTEEIVKWIPLR